MGNVFFGLFVVLVVVGTFMLSSAIDQRLTNNARVGRMLRGFLIESLGFIALWAGVASGGKLLLAMPWALMSISVGGMAGLIAGLLIPRMQANYEAKMASSSEDKPQ